jgi:hypothetical protein
MNQIQFVASCKIGILVMNAWVGIIGTLAGTILGGSLTWLNMRFQLKHQEGRERKKLLLEKLEELHEDLSAYSQSYNQLISARLETLTNGEKWPADSPNLLPKLRMLVGFYAPELRETLIRVEQCREEGGDVLGKCIGLERKKESEQKEVVGALFSFQRKLLRACEEMQAEVVALSKDYL